MGKMTSYGTNAKLPSPALQIQPEALSVNETLAVLGRDLADRMEAIVFDYRNIDTGKLILSFEHQHTYISDDKFNIVIKQMFYGKYLNAYNNKKFGYRMGHIDRAFDELLPNGIDDIVSGVMKESFEGISRKMMEGEIRRNTAYEALQNATK